LSLVRPSVSLLVEGLSFVSSFLNEDGKESEIHPALKHVDDACQYITIGGMTEEGVLALPFPV